jgi:hypothetical protein
MKSILVAVAIAMASPAPLSAAELEYPRGATWLTVRGAIDNTNSGKAHTAEFDVYMLMELAGRQAVMATPWTMGRTRFDGPLLKSVLDAVGAHGSRLIIRDLDDNAVELPLGDAVDLRTMLALKMNGDFMPPRDEGPLFLVYPFDSNPELYNETYFSRSLARVKEIEVVE